MSDPQSQETPGSFRPSFAKSRSTLSAFSRLSNLTVHSENERARLMSTLYADRENQPFGESRISETNLLNEQPISSQADTQVKNGCSSSSFRTSLHHKDLDSKISDDFYLVLFSIFITLFVTFRFLLGLYSNMNRDNIQFLFKTL